MEYGSLSLHLCFPKRSRLPLTLGHLCLICLGRTLLMVQTHLVLGSWQVLSAKLSQQEESYLTCIHAAFKVHLVQHFIEVHKEFTGAAYGTQCVHNRSTINCGLAEVAISVCVLVSQGHSRFRFSFSLKDYTAVPVLYRHLWIQAKVSLHNRWPFVTGRPYFQDVIVWRVRNTYSTVTTL